MGDYKDKRGFYDDSPYNAPLRRQSPKGERLSSREPEDVRKDDYYDPRDRKDRYDRYNPPPIGRNVLDSIDILSYELQIAKNLLKDTSLKVTKLEVKASEIQEKESPETNKDALLAFNSVKDTQKDLLKRLETLERNISNLQTLDLKIENMELRLKNVENNNG